MTVSARGYAITAGALIALSGCSDGTAADGEQAVITSPSDVPPPIVRQHSAAVHLRLDVVEGTIRDRTGVERASWTLEGITPGSIVRVREDDRVVFELRNRAENRMPHAIVLRAVTGEGVGVSSSFTSPGRTSRFTFEATAPGVFSYQSATAHMDPGIINGMHGLILVEPAEGLPALPPGERESAAGLLQRMLELGGFAETATSGVSRGGRVTLRERDADRPVPASRSKAERIELGRRVYERACAACHQHDGQGVSRVFPPLAASDYLLADRRRAIEAVTHGLRGEIEVNGAAFDGVMPASALDDDDVANVMTYVLNSWGNEGDAVTLDEVRAARAAPLHR